MSCLPPPFRNFHSVEFSPWGALAAVLLAAGCATTGVPAKAPSGHTPTKTSSVGNAPELAAIPKQSPVRAHRTLPERREPQPAGKEELRATIRDPGPDLANFPNASYTLPEGGVYLEMSPVNLQGASINGPKIWNWDILVRYGLTDAVELRLFTQGLSVQGPPQSTTGFGPLTFDTKIHLAEEESDHFNYSLGIEAYIPTP